MKEIIYILTNKAMPGWIKIGLTTISVEKRMRELDKTSIPLPFQCFYAGAVKDGKLVEKKIHFIFGEPHQRPRSSREWFFRVDPERVKAAIELIAFEDVTPQIENPLTSEEIVSLVENERKEPFRFSFARIPIGAKLTFTRDESKKCTVINDKQIDFKGQITSLSNAASILLKELGYKSTQVQGPLYWLFEEETLVARRQRIEDEA